MDRFDGAKVGHPPYLTKLHIPYSIFNTTEPIPVLYC